MKPQTWLGLINHMFDDFCRNFTWHPTSRDLQSKRAIANEIMYGAPGLNLSGPHCCDLAGKIDVAAAPDPAGADSTEPCGKSCEAPATNSQE